MDRSPSPAWPHTIDEAAAVDLVTGLIAIPGGSGREGAVAARVRDELLAAGLSANAIADDGAHTRGPFGGELGNQVVSIDGHGGLAGAPAIMLSCHLDTVPLCVGTTPRRADGRIVPASPDKALGADNRSGVGALVTVVRELRRQQLPHPPLKLVFFVQEEVGLVGSRWADRGLLGDPAFCLNIDGGLAWEICHAATGGVKWHAVFRGRAAHAGVHPRDGISAAIMFGRALAELDAAGWHGAVDRDGCHGTANVGMVHGGDATNVVMDELTVTGECRSHDEPFMEVIYRQYREAFQRAAAGLHNEAGEAGSCEFTEDNRYPPFRVETDSPPIRRLLRVLEPAGIEPVYRVSNGAQDANSLNRLHGIPTVTIGAGAHHLHTVNEYLDLREYLDAARLLLAVVTAPG